MARKKKYVPKDFESIKGAGDTSANIYHSMITHPAWLDLTKSQQVLYLVCKGEMYAQRPKEKEKFTDEDEKYRDQTYFVFNQYKWREKYRLYTNRNRFYEDMNALIAHGFIDCVIRGNTTRTKNLYRYSRRWQNWGTEAFDIPFSVMSAALENDLRNKGLIP